MTINEVTERMAMLARGLMTLTLSLLLGAGCRTGLDRSVPAAPSGGFSIRERAETGPITAMAIKPPYLWAAGAPGLRRWNIESGEVELVGRAGQPGGAGIVAIAIDDEGGAWVATPTEIGRWTRVGEALHYQPKGSPPGRVTALAVRKPVDVQGVWVGTVDGLFRFDGRGFIPVDGLRGVAVTSLSLDDDGRAVWVGTRGGGMFRSDGDRAAPVPGGEVIGLDAVVGAATTAAGTRVVAGNAGGEARIYALTLAGVEGYRAPAGIRVDALCDRGGDALLVAGLPGREQAYTLGPLGPGETVLAGSLRLSPLLRERGGRWVATPVALRLPSGAGVTAAAGLDLYAGSARLGLARAMADGPEALRGSELVGDAEHFTVACLTRARCFVVTDGPFAWETDGDVYRPARVGAPTGAAALAVATDARGTVYAISAEAQPPGLVITKHREADAVADVDSGKEWQPVQHVPLDLPPKTTAKASFATLSPAGALWVGLRAVNDNGESVGFGAVEIDLSNGHSVEHRPYRATEHAAPEALPLPADLTGMLFDSGLTWYAALGGISRLQEGQLRNWSENDGLPSERVHAIGRGNDGAPWAATSDGLVRFDGKDWRAFGSNEITTRGLATDGKGRVWVATSKGLRVIGTDAAVAPVVLDGDMYDVVADKFGRVWAMSRATIALVEEK